ncbi:ATP-dependent RNA helicase, putative [Medicago truncatula]|uniref:ATP-dependent RNA helicase, putative n=1 Tax=Medicago truncatula TaxID=3880 RepID=G7IYM4_MEDTR|nr:ATP-dependent RNA helicase, putative [Medicago truncatula]
MRALPPETRIHKLQEELVGVCLYPDELATTLQLDDMDYLIECLKQPFDHVTRVGIFPFYEQVELFPGNIPMGMLKCSAQNDSGILDLESRHPVLFSYLWLSNHFDEDNFPYAKKAEAMVSDNACLLG